MASNLQIHKPYVIKALPRPLDRVSGPGRHHVGEVFGQKQGCKKRKRSELSVAIDGDSVHLYDIPSQQAITSYLVSPQSSFTCAPLSLRWRSSTSKNTARYTYVSTQDEVSSKQEVKLFKDVVAELDSTTNTTASFNHRCDKPIIHLSATSFKSSPSLGGQDAPTHDIVAVAGDGTIIGLDGETLTKKWQASGSIMSQEVSGAAKASFQVDFVHSASAADVIDGMFGGENELFGVFTEKVHRDGFNPDILLAITSTGESRHLHVLALTAGSGGETARAQNVIPVFVVPLPFGVSSTKIQLDAKAGILQELSQGVLYTYSFSSGIPRLENKLQVAGMASFLRLSKTSVLATTPTSVSIYNPVFRSLQASASMYTEDEAQDVNDIPCELFTYLQSRELAIGIRGTSLIAVQIEAPKTRNNKRRAEGLLADAIRRGLSHDGLCEKRPRGEHPTPAILSNTLPGSMSEEYWTEWHKQVSRADKYLAESDLAAFERLLAGVFGVAIKEKKAKTDGVHVDGDGKEKEEPATTSPLQWKWPSSRANYPKTDRRWVFYAINRVFEWNNVQDPEAPHLTCRLPESNVLNYLVDAGHLSTSNLKSAFKDEIKELDEVDAILAQELPPLLVEIDATMELLISYVSGTQLGPTELVSSLKLILRSLDLLQDPSKAMGALTNEESGQDNEGNDEVVAMELERVEEQLQIAEYYLGKDEGKRERGLSVAFSKLAACPTLPVVQSLRRLLKPEEVLSLISVLRMELIKDGWTTRYLEGWNDAEEELEAAPDGSIDLLATLLSRCIDSIGLGGWMTFDTLAGNWGVEDSVDFFSQVQAEVSTALEGVCEAIRLQGTIAEAVTYLGKANKALGTENNGKSSSKAIMAVPTTGPLPLGLKADFKPSAERIRSGGEIVQRSKREIGLFASKKRSAYSVLRISEDTLLQGGGNVAVREEAR
ncbi:hypothetical protein V8F20_008265 [Naviculisporaceae sp. PSN 640]